MDFRGKLQRKTCSVWRTLRIFLLAYSLLAPSTLAEKPVQTPGVPDTGSAMASGGVGVVSVAQPLAAKVGPDHLLEIPHRAFHISTALKLAKACKVHEITLIHSHGKGAGIYSRIVAWLSGRPVIHTPHGLHLERYRLVGKWIYLAIERYLSGPFRKIIFVSPSEKDNAENRFNIWRGKGVVIINGVAEVDEVAVSRWRADARAELSLDATTPVVITVSRFDPAKNMQEAVSVAQALKDMVFVWVGEVTNIPTRNHWSSMQITIIFQNCYGTNSLSPTLKQMQKPGLSMLATRK